MSLLVGQVNFFQDKPVGFPRVRGICNRYTHGYGKLVYRFLNKFYFLNYSFYFFSCLSYITDGIVIYENLKFYL